MMEIWNNQPWTRKKCQYCKQEKDCRRGPDPFLFYSFDEIETVWLCDECFVLRKDGDHLDGEEDLEV